MNNIKLAALALSAAVSMSIALPIAAQTTNNDADDAGIEEVFVLGKRRAYQGNFDNLENPAADQTISEDLLREAGVISLDDALDLSAAVARQNNFGGLWNSFSVRGFSGDINLPSGFLVNGFNAGRGFAGPRDIIGIESVEVLKGPRSALFGRGEPGGTVNLITKRPQFKKGGEVSATFGRWDQMRFEGDFQTVAGSNEEVGIRLVGFYEDAESFRDTVETEKRGFYPSITWDVSESTSINYELEYTEQELPFDRGVVYSDRFGFSPRATFAGEPGDGPIETEVVGHQFELQHNISDSWSLLAGLGYRGTEFKGNASEPNFGSRQTYFLDGRTLSRFFRYRDFESDYFVARAEVAGQFETGSVRHRLLIGADYDRFENSLFILRFRPPGGVKDVSSIDPATYLLLDVFNPIYGQYPLPVPGANTDREENLDGFGFYIQDQIDLSGKLQVRLGLRWDDFEQDLTNNRAVPISTTKSSDDRLSPQLGVVYKANDGFSLYGSYGEGFRQQTGSDFQGNQFDPNITESAEIGFKLDLGHFNDGVSGSVNVALFDIKQSNILVNDDRDFVTGFFSIDAGEAEGRGIEIDADLAFESGLNLWFSYAYTDAEYSNSNPDADGFGTIEKGDPLINSPEHQLNLQISQSFEVAGMSAQAGAGLQYTDERAGFVTSDFKLPDYTIARFFAQLKPTERLALRLDLNNAFDEEFYTNSFADVWVGPGMPRRWRFSTVYSF
ncbi:MAG: TonB-dependent siderophore receptor [Pseudohongiellaceae bacterium]